MPRLRQRRKEIRSDVWRLVRWLIAMRTRRALGLVDPISTYVLSRICASILILLVACGPQCLSSLQSRAIGRRLFRAALEHLDQVPAERRLHRPADLIDLQCRHRLLELRHCVTRVQPAKIAAAAATRVERMQACQCSELDLPGFDANLHFFEPPLDLWFGSQVRHSQQDVACMCLLHRASCEFAVEGAATPQHLQNMKTVRAADHRTDLVNFQRLGRVDKKRGQTVCVTPAEFTALQCFGCVRIAGSDPRKFRTALQLRDQFVSAIASCDDAIVRGIFRNTQQDLRKIDFLRVRGHAGLRSNEVLQLAFEI